jgi:hypothetical protein
MPLTFPSIIGCPSRGLPLYLDGLLRHSWQGNADQRQEGE